jgi:hypothetical protein
MIVILFYNSTLPTQLVRPTPKEQNAERVTATSSASLPLAPGRSFYPALWFKVERTLVVFLIVM